MPPEASDPAEWSRASETPDIGGDLDTLTDFLRESATARLKHLPAKDRVAVVDAVTQIALEGIERAKAEGLLHDNDTVTWTPQFREILAHIFSELLDAGKERCLLLAQCFDFAFGLGLQLGISEQEIANQHGMTRSNVSKICVGMRERYDVPPSRGMRSIATCEKYSARQRGRRAKPAAEPWIHLDALRSAFTNPFAHAA